MPMDPMRWTLLWACLTSTAWLLVGLNRVCRLAQPSGALLLMAVGAVLHFAFGYSVHGPSAVRLVPLQNVTLWGGLGVAAGGGGLLLAEGHSAAGFLWACGGMVGLYSALPYNLALLQADPEEDGPSWSAGLAAPAWSAVLLGALLALGSL